MKLPFAVKLGFCLLLLSALSLTAADVNVTGKWSGSFEAADPDGQSKTSTALLNLKQTGTDITGTAGPNEDEQMPIVKGKIEGDQITLQVDHDGATLQFKLVLAGDHIKGDATMSREGQTRTAKIDVTRAK